MAGVGAVTASIDGTVSAALPTSQLAACRSAAVTAWVGLRLGLGLAESGWLAGCEARALGWIEARARTCASQRAGRDATPHVHPNTPAGRAAANQQADDRQTSRVRHGWVVVTPGSTSGPDRVAIGHNWAHGSVDPQVQSGQWIE